jgi:hypothetical protein
MAGNFERKTASKSDHAGFRGTVGRFARVADDWPRDRRDVHDPPIVCGQHERKHGLRDVEGGLQIDGNAVIPLLFGKVGQRLRGGLGGTANLGHAGIVDENMEAPITAQDFFYERVSARVVARICGGSKDIAARGGEFAGALMDSFCRRSDCNF